MIRDPLLDEIVSIFRTDHKCHTVILYGSRARGEATPASDYDVLGIRDFGPSLRDARFYKGVYLDLFVYPKEEWVDPKQEMVHVRQGIVLIEKDGIGQQVLARLQEMYNAGPEKMPDDQMIALRLWALKSLSRVKAGGVEGNFRRMEFIPALLEQYFTTRNEWYLGPKASLRWLSEHRPDVFGAFECALRPSATQDELENLVSLVYPQTSSASETSA